MDLTLEAAGKREVPSHALAVITVPVYGYRELEQYRVSNNANLQCKESIEAAVREPVSYTHLFLYEEELRRTNARLVELDTLLNIDGKGPAHDEAVVAKSTRPSVLDHLKRPVPPRSTDKKPKQHEEVR